EWLQQLASVEPTQSICLRCADGNTTIRVYRGAAFVVPDVPRWHPCSWRAEPELIVQGDRGIAGRVLTIGSGDTTALRKPLDSDHWTLRMREEGDVIELSVRSGRVNVKNIFQNAGVPPWQRERWPILICGKTVVSVVGLATANAFTARDGEQRVEIEWKPGRWKPA
ncbi:MAG: tRNA lysidine(34) synthetase TilS, partial [Casimicrobium sp.]